MPDKKKKKSFWRNIKFKYKLTILNENTLEDIFTLRVSKLNIISVLIVVILLSILISSAVLIFTPLKNYLPGYVTNQLRNQMVDNALLTDSLVSVIDKQNVYINNIQTILRGEVIEDNIKNIDSLSKKTVTDSIMTISQSEKDFREKYEEDERYNIISTTQDKLLQDVVIIKPLSGTIMEKYSSKNNKLGITIVSDEEQPILSVMDGAILYADYTSKNGNTIIISHNQDFISVYKNCGLFLKKEGDIVRAGEPISTIKSNRNMDKALSFEIWHKGKSVDPEKYITF